MSSVDEWRMAIEDPGDKWTVFLHPDQRPTVERDDAEPARVRGSAGKGKTIVTLHRAAHLEQMTPDARVLLTTYTNRLINATRCFSRGLGWDVPRKASARHRLEGS